MRPSPDVTLVAPPHQWATGATLAAIVLVAISFAAVLFLHVVRRDINPMRTVMSTYANGHDGPVMTVAFYAFGLSSIALAVRMRSAVAARGLTRLVPALMGLGGIGLVVAGVFEVDREDIPDSLAEMVHSNSAIAGFALLTTAMVLFAFACRRDHRWWPFRWTSASLALVTTTAAAMTMVTRQVGSPGGVQRLLAASVLLWMLLACRHLRSCAFHSS